jgi:hypothetical protein
MAFVVYSYPGFGDFCIAFGIIREYAKWNEKILYYTDSYGIDEERYKTRKRLYKSLKNVEIVPEIYNKENHGLNLGIAHMKSWFDIVRPWQENERLEPPDWFNEDWYFDKILYKQMYVPFDLKWDNFYFERDLEKEKEVYYDQLGLKDNEEFILMFEDTYRSYTINRNYINPNIKLIDLYNLRHISMLDILYTVEKAKEFHTINTGLLIYIDQMNIQHNKLYYHKYNRSCFWDQPGLRLNWKIID